MQKDPRATDSTADAKGGSDGPSAERVAKDPVNKDPVNKDPLAGDPLAGDPLAGDPLAGDPLAGDSVNEDSVNEERLSMEELQLLIRALEKNMSHVVLGKPDVVRKCLVALLAGEHVLLEDVPGVGKTLVGKAVAKSVSGEFCRLQFTPDLLPSDIVGSSVFHGKTHEFIFNRGPVFSNIVLADEINRAPPRTQSALLEAMSDGQVSVDGVTYDLPQPFMVIATQNPFEFEGTYTLPESQLDRFLLRISMGYPARRDERRVLSTHRSGEPVEALTPVLDCRQIRQLQQMVREVDVDDAIADYMLDIVQVTRDCEDLHVGVSTRGALSLYRATQSAALVEGRQYVVPDDVKGLIEAVLVHRVIPKGFFQAGQRGDTEALIRRLVEQVPVPQ